MLIMPTPEYLRNLADEREKAGDESTAESLRNEADELEKAPAPAEAAPQ